MKKTMIKVLEFAAVIVALVIAVIVTMNIGVESLLRGKEEAVTLSMTEGGLPRNSESGNMEIGNGGRAK